MLKIKGKYYIGQILTPNRLIGGYLNVIQCPTGSGKTYFALDELPKYVQSNNHILYLTDTNMNKEQIISNFKNTKEYDKYWREFINKSTKSKLIPNGWGTYNRTYITIMNYAQVGAILHYGHNFDWSKFEYVICDELHNLINYQNIRVNGNSVNILKDTKRKIEETIIKYPDVKVVCLTATPSKVYQKFLKTYTVLTQQEYDSLFRYETKNVIYYDDPMKTLAEINKERKGIIYFNRIDKLIEVEEILMRKGHKTACIWSKRYNTLVNSEKAMSQRQLDVREHIIKNELIPNYIDILLINGACETGVNIKNNDIGFMMIHSDDNDTITQARGRLRRDLQTLYIYSPTATNKPNDVPPEYLNIPLTAEEKEILCVEIIRLLKKDGTPYKWGETKKYLESIGYKITDGKSKRVEGISKRASLIELQ